MKNNSGNSNGVAHTTPEAAAIGKQSEQFPQLVFLHRQNSLFSHSLADVMNAQTGVEIDLDSSQY